MNISSVYKALMTFVIIILSLASASGQDAYTVVRYSKLKYKVTANADVQTYVWRVYTDKDLSFEANASTQCKLTPVTGEPNAIHVEWLDDGVYYLTLYANGTNGCSNKKAWKYTVVSTPTIIFNEIASSDCADDEDKFATQVIAELKAGIALADSQYPITVNYEVTYNGETKPYTTDVAYGDQLLNIEGITEDISNDKIYSIKIIGATTIFGGKINPGAEDIYTRTIYAIPNIEDITY